MRCESNGARGAVREVRSEVRSEGGGAEEVVEEAMEETNRRGQARTRAPVQAKSLRIAHACVCAAVGAHRMHAFGVRDA